MTNQDEKSITSRVALSGKINLNLSIASTCDDHAAAGAGRTSSSPAPGWRCAARKHVTRSLDNTDRRFGQPSGSAKPSVRRKPMARPALPVRCGHAGTSRDPGDSATTRRPAGIGAAEAAGRRAFSRRRGVPAGFSGTRGARRPIISSVSADMPLGQGASCSADLPSAARAGDGGRTAVTSAR